MDTLNQPSSSQPTNQPAAEQPPTINPKSSLHPKALLLTSAFFVLLFASLTAILLGSRTRPTSQLRPSVISPTISQPSPTPDPTANWKTYTSSKFRYSIKYPPTWSLKETPYGDFNGTTVFLPSGEIYDNPGARNRGIAIDFRDITNIPPLPGNTLNQRTEPSTPQSGYQKESSTIYKYHKIRSVYIKDAGFEVDVLEPDFARAAEIYRAAIRYDKYEYIFYFGKELDRKYEAIFDQILSTFRFIE